MAKLIKDPQQLGKEFETLVAFRFLKYFETPQVIENFTILPSSLISKHAGKHARLRVPFRKLPNLIQPLNKDDVWIGGFLNNGIPPFAFPDTNTGPDIIFTLEILDSQMKVESKVLVLVQCKLVKEKPNINTAILRTTTFDGLFTRYKNNLNFSSLF